MTLTMTQASPCPGRNKTGWNKRRWLSPTPFLILFLALCLLCPGPAPAEYYEYTDKNGVKTFTDNQAMVPSGKVKTTVHKEEFDHLDEAEKERMRKLQEEALERQKQETREWLEQSRQKEAAEKKQEEERKREQRQQALKTPVAIMGNRILVPVTLTVTGSKTTVPLLLDTGASITSIDRSVAEALNLTRGRKSAAIVAGGGILRTRIARVDAIQVGPWEISAMEVMILPEKGHDFVYKGLLGQDFLRHFNYTIDHENQVIQWTDPESR